MPHLAFTRALSCMSKYSEELFINAMPNSVSFSATNASLSAYCRFTYDRSFFAKFNIGNEVMGEGISDLDDMEQAQTVAGQLCVQVFSSSDEKRVSSLIERCHSPYSRFSNTKA